MLKIESIKNSKAKNISYGEKIRVSIARACMTKQFGIYNNLLDYNFKSDNTLKDDECNIESRLDKSSLVEKELDLSDEIGYKFIDKL